MADANVAIVTGAGSGIGRCVAELLANAGHRIALVGRTERALQKTMARITSGSAAPPEMLVVPADIADADQAASVVDLTVERWGRLDVLVNNAGTAELAPIEETDADMIYRTFAVNVFGPAMLISRAWPIFRRQHSGRIVNVSSMASVDPFPGFFAYAAAKSAVESLTRSAANEGREHGVRAFSVAPGAVETGTLRGLFSERDLPPARTLDPRDVAHVICDCVLGRRERDAGTTIHLPSP
jgi:NAD(P)-dependent dehydrogenase (short-subunit alcohol dehydrogenase family)